jgi:hypothetical protein
MNRSAALSHFYDCTQRVLLAQAVDKAPAMLATHRIFGALAETQGALTAPLPATIAPCSHFGVAIRNAQQGPPPIASLAAAFLALSPTLVWKQRQGANAVGEPFASGHANTVVAGQSGLEVRDDVIVGASLVAPGINYPEHKHAPEEMYIVLSEGDWYNEEAGWYTPGIGEVVYHRPWLRHAMRSAEQPLLAVWCLFVDADTV